jgi:predicted nucleic acid-binding Zn ribbon protein
MLELIVGIVLATGAMFFVLRPIVAPKPESDAGDDADEGLDPDDDMSPRAVALRALKEIEFDRATGKLSDADYEALKQKYTGAAVTALRDEGRGTGEVSIKSVTTRPPSLVPRPACAVHGPRPEKDAHFCSECGRRLGDAGGFCARCGTPLEADARFCSACGRRIAA